MKTEEKVKVHMREILEQEIQEPRKVFVIGDRKYYADKTTKERLSTHDDCQKCNIEFEKEWTYSKYCNSCQSEIEQESYNQLELVEWDGKTPLANLDGDIYFFDEDDILSYCEDHDCQPSDLRLVLCKKTHFSEVDVYEQQIENVHENWEPDAELVKLTDALNEYLRTASTNTWIGDNKRVDVSNLTI